MKTNEYKYIGLYVTTALTALGLSTSVYAQASSSGSGTVDEVVVTARLIEESLQDIPVSVAAFSEEMIEQRGIEDLTEIARSTPNFSFENFNGAFPVPVIRGQSQNRLTNPVQNVATFYNGIYIQRSYMVDASLLNIGQVEILRGPQSAAFGRNAYAGAINFRTKKIGDEPAFHVALSGGEDEYERYDLTGSLPIGEKFGVMAGFSHAEYDGAWENNHALADISDPIARTTGNLGGFDNDTFQVGLSFTPTDKLSFDLNFLSSERDVENVPQHTLSGSGLYSVNTLNCSLTGALGGNNLFCGDLPVEPVLVPGGTRGPGLIVDPRAGLSLESDILSFQVDYRFNEKLSLTFLYGETEGVFEGAGSSVYDQEVGYDGPFATPPIFLDRLLIDTSGNGSIEGESYEMRLNWTPNDTVTAYFGGYHSISDDLTDFALLSVPAQTTGPLDPGFELNFPGFAANSENSRDISSAFFFVNVDRGDWTFSAEGRYTEEAIYETNFVAGTSARQDYDYFTPRVTASYFLNDNSSVYASYARGVKTGGFNTGGSDPASFADPTQATFDEESNNTLEFGSRNVLLDGALTLNATLFFIDAKDLQVNVPLVGGPGSVIGNRAEADTLGLEVEAVWDLSDELQFYGGFGYTNAEYGDVIDPANAARCDDIVCASSGDISGNQLERAPAITINAGFDWTRVVSDDMSYYVRGSVGYQDEQYSNAINTATIEARTIVDASVGMTWRDFEARITADNLFDEEYVSSAFEVGFLSSYIPNLGNRRRLALTLSYRY